jgi:nucleosome assembly protein 1-like 1
LKSVKGTTIDWKEGRALTYRVVKKKQRGKGKHAGQVRTVEKKEDLESFFRWFEPPEMPPMEDLDEEEANRLEEIYDEDFEVAQAFRYQLIPQAVMFFTGEFGDDHVTLAMDGQLEGDADEE